MTQVDDALPGARHTGSVAPAGGARDPGSAARVRPGTPQGSLLGGAGPRAGCTGPLPGCDGPLAAPTTGDGARPAAPWWRDGSGSIAEMASAAGLRRIQMLAWRDLDDEEAGGSELHASMIAERWSAAGLDVTMRTSAVAGQPAQLSRHGYQVLRRAGRYAVFPACDGRRRRSAAAGTRRPGGDLERHALLLPPLGPLAPRRLPSPRPCRHVGDGHPSSRVWPALGKDRGVHAGARRVPAKPDRDPFGVGPGRDRRASRGCQPIASPWSPPGVHPRFSPGPTRSPYPLVVAVGRLVPVKRFDVLIDALVELRARHPGLGLSSPARAGNEPPSSPGSTTGLPVSGSGCRVGSIEDELVTLYRRAWVVASTSAHEGWGMTLTEAAACGTPSVATAIPGHVDAVLHGSRGWWPATTAGWCRRSTPCCPTRCCDAGSARQPVPGPPG